MPMKFYAVRRGRNTGIFDNWPDCQAQTHGFKSALFKSFGSMSEAQEWMGIGNQSTNQSTNQSATYQSNRQSISNQSHNRPVSNQSNRPSPISARSTNQRSYQPEYEPPPSCSSLSQPPAYQSQPHYEEECDSPLYTHFLGGGMFYGQAGYGIDYDDEPEVVSPISTRHHHQSAPSTSRQYHATPSRAQPRTESIGLAVVTSPMEVSPARPPVAPLRKMAPHCRQPNNSDIHWLYIDGGSRSNPGHAGCGGVIYTPNMQPVAEFKHYLGDHITNNVAEYEGLIRGLEYAIGTLRIGSLRIRADSQLIVSQSKGEWRVNTPHLQWFCDRAQALLDSLDWWEIEQIPRAQNKHADRMSNEAMDQRSREVLIRYDEPDSNINQSINQSSRKRSNSAFQHDSFIGSKKRRGTSLY